MSIRAQREAYKLEIVRFLKNYRQTMACSLYQAVHDFLDPINPYRPDRLHSLAKTANERGQSLPSARTLTRWYNQLEHLHHNPVTLQISSALPDDVIPTLTEIQSHFRKNISDPETYPLLLRVSMLLEQINAS